MATKHWNNRPFYPISSKSRNKSAAVDKQCDLFTSRRGCIIACRSVSINCIFVHNCSLPFKSSLLAPAVASSPGGLGSFCRHQTDCRTVPPSAAVWRWRWCRPPSQRRVNGPFSLNFGTEHLGHLPQPSPAQQPRLPRPHRFSRGARVGLNTKWIHQLNTCKVFTKMCRYSNTFTHYRKISTPQRNKKMSTRETRYNLGMHFQALPWRGEGGNILNCVYTYLVDIFYYAFLTVQWITC